MSKVAVAVIGTGNIGTDLLYKLERSSVLEPRWFVGIDPASDGLRRAAHRGVEVSAGGVEWLLAQPERPVVVFDATSATAHMANAPAYAAAGVKVVDLTPAAIGPYVVPTVNLTEHTDAPNVNMITCGGQATIPIVAAVSSVTSVPYAEIVSSISSRSAGPGTRANVDEFTQTTSRAIEVLGGAASAKAIIVLNPADPPVVMRNSVFCALEPDAELEAVRASIVAMVESVREYVPGYRMVAAPQFDPPQAEWGGRGRVATLLEIRGNGDYLPDYAGNLDIMTAAAVRVGECLTESVQGLPA